MSPTPPASPRCQAGPRQLRGRDGGCQTTPPPPSWPPGPGRALGRGNEEGGPILAAGPEKGSGGAALAGNWVRRPPARPEGGKRGRGYRRQAPAPAHSPARPGCPGAASSRRQRQLSAARARALAQAMALRVRIAPPGWGAGSGRRPAALWSRAGACAAPPAAPGRGRSAPLRPPGSTADKAAVAVPGPADPDGGPSDAGHQRAVRAAEKRPRRSPPETYRRAPAPREGGGGAGGGRAALQKEPNHVLMKASPRISKGFFFLEGKQQSPESKQVPKKELAKGNWCQH